ncbi:hypothetical protein [Lysinibacillus endophyticus]|uniref:hypothetical protein n=1 Tax=Ureibacillus endophyticus TaxID=1978490 RepID=UPI0026B18D5D
MIPILMLIFILLLIVLFIVFVFIQKNGDNHSVDGLLSQEQVKQLQERMKQEK